MEDGSLVWIRLVHSKDQWLAFITAGYYFDERSGCQLHYKRGLLGSAMCHFIDVRESIVLKPVVRPVSYREKERLGALLAFQVTVAVLEWGLECFY